MRDLNNIRMVEESQNFKDLKYMHGFGNHFETECLEGALPIA